MSLTQLIVMRTPQCCWTRIHVMAFPKLYFIPNSTTTSNSESAYTPARPEHFSGRAGLENNYVISGRKNPAHNHRVSAKKSSKIFSGRAWAWAGRPRIL
jgi:hypothetical protein